MTRSLFTGLPALDVPDAQALRQSARHKPKLRRVKQIRCRKETEEDPADKGTLMSCCICVGGAADCGLTGSELVSLDCILKSE